MKKSVRLLWKDVALGAFAIVLLRLAGSRVLDRGTRSLEAMDIKDT